MDTDKQTSYVLGIVNSFFENTKVLFTARVCIDEASMTPVLCETSSPDKRKPFKFVHEYCFNELVAVCPLASPSHPASTLSHHQLLQQLQRCHHRSSQQLSRYQLGIQQTADRVQLHQCLRHSIYSTSSSPHKHNL